MDDAEELESSWRTWKPSFIQGFFILFAILVADGLWLLIAILTGDWGGPRR